MRFLVLSYFLWFAPVAIAQNLSVNLNFAYHTLVIGGNTTVNATLSGGPNATVILNVSKHDLVGAMNILAQDVLDETLTTARELLDVERRLLVTLKMPTNITNASSVACPKSLNTSKSNLCQSISHRVTVIADVNSAGNNSTMSKFQANLNYAIGNGRFQLQLEAYSPDSNVSILNASLFPATPKSTGPTFSVASDIVVGILMVATVLVSVVVFFLKEEPQDDAEALLEGGNP